MNSSGNHRFLSAGKSLVLGTAALLVTLSAQAGTERMDAPAEQKSVVVRFADLNLATTAGAKALFTRISLAASSVCGGQPTIHEMRRQHQYLACYDEALDTAVHKIDSERLQAVYAERKSSQSVG